MKIAVIDDEIDARVALRRMLEEREIAGEIVEADGVLSGLKLINSHKPDIVFMDVMMRDGTGFDLLRQLSSINFKLIIVSGHDEFALQAFRFSAIDYLVKPVDRDDLAGTLRRIQPAAALPWQQMMEVLKQTIQPNKEMERKIVLKDLNAVYVVAVNSIVRCEASDNYTTFYLTDQTPIVVSRSLKEYEELLSPLKFFRAHQSHLININYLQQFNKREGGSIQMKDGSQVPVSSRKREALLAELAKFS